ncbi:reverse transcriptase domain-containing protein, partial [Tanacetum coccineum]
MFKQLHINISIADALVLIPKYQKMLKSLLSNKEKPLNENCSAVILKRLSKKLGDPGKFLIPCGFSELKCKALANLGASINLMPLSMWKKLGLPKLISTQMTLELANLEIYTPVGIERDVFVPEILEDLFATNHPSGNSTSSLTSHTDLTSPEVNDDIFDPEGDIIENLLNLDKTKDLPPYHDNQLSGNPTPVSEPVTKSSSSSTLISIKESDLIWEEFKVYLASDSFPPRNSNPSSPLPPFHISLSGSTTSYSPSLLNSMTSDYSLEEFADELAHITFLPRNDVLPID